MKECLFEFHNTQYYTIQLRYLRTTLKKQIFPSTIRVLKFTLFKTVIKKVRYLNQRGKVLAIVRAN